MVYLTIEDMGKCEVVCHTLKKQATHYWEYLDELYFANHPTLRSPSAQSSREAVIRYKLASTLAKRIGDMGDSISKHLVVRQYRFDGMNGTTTSVRVSEHCQGCSLPDLDFNPFRPETSDEYELFVRFCRRSDNKLLAEGFCPSDRELDSTSIKLRGMDYSQWPQLAELTRLIETSEGDSFGNNDHNDNLLDACMRDLTAIVIAVHKGTSKASLALAQCNFGLAPRGRHDHGIDNMGDHGFCWPIGKMSAKSHGDVETTQRLGDTFSENRHCDAKLGMLWQNHVSNDRESGNVLKVECHWTLDCDCNYVGRVY